MIAVSSSWKREPFNHGTSITLKLEIYKGQIKRISKGFVPVEMEDKWFMYFEEPYLYLHRSWTGQPVFKLEFKENTNGYYVNNALLSSDLAKENELEYQGQLALFLVSNILLGKSILFPKPVHIEELISGVYQHHISGTGYVMLIYTSTY